MYATIKISKRLLCVLLLSILLIVIVIAASLSFKITCLDTNIEDEYVELPILMYHGISKDKKRLNQYVISPDTFEKDVKYIKENGYNTIVMQDLIDYVYEGRSLPIKPIMITFDDGYYNNYLYAYPLLKKYGFKMVLSPIGKCTDMYSEICDKNEWYAHVTWGEINEMVQSGVVEIQNHSYNMHENKCGRNGSKKVRGESLKQYRKFFSDDIIKMQDAISSHTSCNATTFTYPFGAISKESLQILKDLGFKATLTSEQRINKIHKNQDDLYGLYRFVRPHGISTSEFFKKIEAI